VSSAFGGTDAANSGEKTAGQQRSPGQTAHSEVVLGTDCNSSLRSLSRPDSALFDERILFLRLWTLVSEPETEKCAGRASPATNEACAGITFDSKEEYQNPEDLIRFNYEFDSNAIDESDLHRRASTAETFNAGGNDD
jgi:hypothetical protein